MGKEMVKEYLRSSVGALRNPARRFPSWSTPPRPSVPLPTDSPASLRRILRAMASRRTVQEGTDATSCFSEHTAPLSSRGHPHALLMATSLLEVFPPQTVCIRQWPCSNKKGSAGTPHSRKASAIVPWRLRARLRLGRSQAPAGRVRSFRPARSACRSPRTSARWPCTRQRWPR